MTDKTEPKAKRGEGKSVGFTYKGDARDRLQRAVEIFNENGGPGVASASTFTEHATMKAADALIAKDQMHTPDTDTESTS